MSLETAAGTALEKVKELLPKIESGEEALGRAADAIDARVEEVEEGWAELREYARAFNERSERRSADAADRQRAQAQRIAELEVQLEEVRKEIGDEVERAVDALGELREQADEAREELAALMERAEEEAVRFAARQRELAGRITDAVSGLARFLVEDAASAVDGVRDAVVERAEGLGGTLDEAAGAIAEGAAATVDALGQAGRDALGTLAELAARMSSAAEELTDAAVRQVTACGADVVQHWEDGAERALAELEQALERGAQDVDGARGRLDDLGRRAGDGLNDVIAGASGALEFFSRFTFL
jgi:ABC-type transporter Mla subunit MlaD